MPFHQKDEKDENNTIQNEYGKSMLKYFYQLIFDELNFINEINNYKGLQLNHFLYLFIFFDNQLVSEIEQEVIDQNISDEDLISYIVNDLSNDFEELIYNQLSIRVIDNRKLEFFQYQIIEVILYKRLCKFQY